MGTRKLALGKLIMAYLLRSPVHSLNNFVRQDAAKDGFILGMNKGAGVWRIEDLSEAVPQ